MSKIQFAFMTTLLVMIAALLALPIVLSPKPTKPAMGRWEYMIKGFADDKFAQEIGEAGANGWEIASARRAIDNGQGTYEVIFKRPVQGE